MVEPPSAVERDLQQLEVDLKRLEAEYNMYFSGRLPKPPWETRKRVADLVNNQEGTGCVSLSLPSLRVDAFTVGIASEIQKVRRTGLTFAPEGGTWRIRQVLNKLITEDDLYSAVEGAYSQGWRRVKLYFLTGVPTEMDDDTRGIAELARNVVAIGRRYNKQASCTASIGGFVPKPHTPFQWFGQNGVREMHRKIELLRGAVRKSGVQLRWHDPEATFVEGIASRGDRRIGRVIERVWRDGGTFQEEPLTETA